MHYQHKPNRSSLFCIVTDQLIRKQGRGNEDAILAQNNVNMVLVPVQVGASLSFKGTGKGSHSKIRKGRGCKQSVRAARTGQRYKAQDYISRLPLNEGSNRERQRLDTAHIAVLLGFIVYQKMKETGGAG